MEHFQIGANFGDKDSCDTTPSQSLKLINQHMSTMPQPTGGHRIINPYAKPNAKQGMEVDACGGSATQVRRGALATNVGASPSQIAENRCFCGATVRPYRGTEGRGDGAVLTQFHPKRNNENNDNMGCQSQFRNGTIKACMKAATGRKRKNNRLLHQVTVTGQRAFDRMLHCKLCIANNLIERGELSKENKPHRGHHYLCFKNTKTRGQSISFVMSKRAFIDNFKHINTPPVRKPGTRAEGQDMRSLLSTGENAASTTITSTAPTAAAPPPNTNPNMDAS